MIKINLWEDSSGRSNAWKYGLAAYAASVAVCAALFVSMYQDIVVNVRDKEEEIGRLNQRLAALQEQTKKVDELEAKKQLVNSKLALIARLKKSKTGPVRVMDDLNTSLPSNVWLRSVQEKGGVFQIKGRAMDNQDIARFLKNLEASDYFDQVELVKSVQMYYSKRTGQVTPTPDLQALRSASQAFKSESRATKDTAAIAGATGQRWSVRDGGKEQGNRRVVVDEFNVKIKEFLVTAKVNYAGKIAKPAAEEAAAPAVRS